MKESAVEPAMLCGNAGMAPKRGKGEGPVRSRAAAGPFFAAERPG